MENNFNKTENGDEINEASVAAYLQTHSDFFTRYPDLLEHMVFPEKKLGENIVDFQHYALSHLQKNIVKERGKFQDLLTSARENVSIQHQVQQAIKCVVRAKNIYELYDIIIDDFLTIFDVDVVRIAIETNIVDGYEVDPFDMGKLGVILLPMGVCNSLCGNHISFLSGDITSEYNEIVEHVFFDSAWLVRSCVMIRLESDVYGREGLLCFGSREQGRYQNGQRVDLLEFLAEIIEERLDSCLKETGIDIIL